MDSSTGEGAGRAMGLGGALQAFAATVEVAGAPGDGQLDIQLGDLGGKRGWRLAIGIIRLTGDLTPAVSAVCVVSESRPRRGRVFRMMALAVEGKMRGRRIATEAIARLKAELALRAGPGFRAEG